MMAQIEKKMRHRRGCDGAAMCAPNPWDSPLGPGPGRFFGPPLEPFWSASKSTRAFCMAVSYIIQYTCTEKCTIYAHIMLTLDEF
jgi:hypothetical protein